MIEAFLSHRREVVTRRTVYELREARKRGHVLEGLAVALANIDEFIALIKAAPTPPVAKSQLMARTWESALVREMLGRAEDMSAFRPDGLDPSAGLLHARDGRAGFGRRLLAAHQHQVAGTVPDHPLRDS